MAKILVIDNNASARDEMVSWLVSENHVVLSAEDSLTGIEYAIRHRPDLIICDVTVPHLDGFSVLLEIRANLITSKIPFIFLTTDSTHEDMRYGISLGVDDYAARPFTDREEFLQTVQARLQNQTIQDSNYQHEVAFLEQALAEEQEQRLLKAKLVAMFAHDFRNPLASILSSNTLLRDYANRLDEQRRLIHRNRIDASVRQLVQMLDELLILVQIESGKLEFKPKMLPVGHFIQSIVEEFRAIYSETYHILFECLFLDEMNADPRLLREIAANLISNAIKYSPHESEVRVTIDQHKGQFRLIVQDQGIGIPDVDQELMFDAFKRGSNVGDILGTGLGLAIVKQAVDIHGGSIHLESKMGIGTTVTIMIPVHPG